jgi:2-oxoglutarate ferredoxin oxidoreductase subunit alpha
MVIALRNHTDSFYQTARAFYLAEKYQLPVILLSDQYLGDSYATVKPYDLTEVHTLQAPAESYITGSTPDIPEGEYLRYRFTEDGISPRLIPGRTKNFVTADSDEHDEMGRITEESEMRIRMMDKRMGKLKLLEQELIEPEFLGAEEYDTLLLGWGSVYGPIAEAVTALNKEAGKRYAALVFGDVYPLPRKLLLVKAAKADSIINVEQNATGQLAQLIREQTGIACTSGILKYDGRQITGEELAARLRKGESA